MSGFLSGLLSILTGGISNIFEGGSWNNLGNIMNNAGVTANDLGNQNIGGNLVAKYTGSRLTDAEREANAWTASREDLAWNRQTEAANTSYQRQVADMQAAGINPMMAVSGSGGAAVPSASVSGSVSPSGASLNLGSLLSLALEAKLLPAKIANLASQTNKNNADAAKAGAETEGQNISNEFASSLNQLKLDLGEMEKKQRDGSLRLTESEIDKNKQWVSESEMRIEQVLKQIEDLDDQILTREAVREMYRANARLSRANADSVEILRSSQQALLNAQTEAERQRAAELVLSTAYKQGLLDNDYIKALTQDLRASASLKSSEVKKNKQWIEESDVREALMKGDFDKLTDRGRLWLWAQSL